jgi:hypothetical protein
MGVQRFSRRDGRSRGRIFGVRLSWAGTQRYLESLGAMRYKEEGREGAERELLQAAHEMTKENLWNL